MLKNNGSWPQFLIAGFQKCGTTTLFHYLREHPQIIPPLKKELQYFDKHYYRSRRWYRGYFPSSTELGAEGITGEASTDYIFHPHALQRIMDAPFNPRIIIILRDPVFRAFSQYQHYKRLGYEKEAFGDALDRESARLDLYLSQIKSRSKKHSEADFNYIRFAYLKKGLYAHYIERLWENFEPDQTHILFLEELRQDPAREIRKVCRFLGISEKFEPSSEQARNRGEYSDIERKDLDYLKEYYRIPNQRLAELLQRPLPFA